MEDIKTNALSKDLNETEAIAVNKGADEEIKISQNPNAEADDTLQSPAQPKPKTRRKTAQKEADSDTAENPTVEKKTTRKRNTAKKVSDSPKKNSEEAVATVYEEELKKNSPETEETAKNGEITSVSELCDSNAGVSAEISDASEEHTTEENDAPLNLTEDTHTEDCQEDESQISFFRISSDEFDAVCSESENSNEAVALPEDEEKSSEDEITPPDELFAYRSKPQAEIIESLNEEDSEEDNTTLGIEDTEQEENVNDDGQYHFSDLEPVPTPEKEKSEPALDKYDPKKPRKIDGRFDLIELFVFTLLAVMILTTFFFRHSIVEGDSMKNTLHSGEHLIISDFFYTPERGDIIVCEDYTTSIKKPIVKRVIAIEGDVITITPDKRVYVNGELLDEDDYVYVDGIDLTGPIDNFKVPENEIFVMGDHRNDSEDSRSIGPISEDAVLGKVILRFYPFDKFGPVK